MLRGVSARWWTKLFKFPIRWEIYGSSETCGGQCIREDSEQEAIGTGAYTDLDESARRRRPKKADGGKDRSTRYADRTKGCVDRTGRRAE